MIGGVFVLPGTACRVIGWAAGETFYQGWPASSWEGRLKGYEMWDSKLSGDLYFKPPPPSWFARTLDRHFGVRLPESRNELKKAAALPVLVELLGSNDRQVRLMAIQCLAAVGAEARPAWPALLEMRSDTDDYLIYREAGIALSCIDHRAAELIVEREDCKELFERYWQVTGRSTR